MPIPPKGQEVPDLIHGWILRLSEQCPPPLLKLPDLAAQRLMSFLLPLQPSRGLIAKRKSLRKHFFLRLPRKL